MNKKTLQKCLTVICAVVLCMATLMFVACDDVTLPTPDQTIETIIPTISVTLSAETIRRGETVTVDVTIMNSENPAYTWTISDPTLVGINANNELTVLKDTKVDKIISVTAVLTADTNVQDSKTIKVIAPVVEGEVCELTSEMLQNLGNSSITVTGTLTDYYQNLKNPSMSTTHAYDMTVKMEENRWSGSWGAADSKNVITDIYCRGEQENVKDENGVIGHNIDKLYINKNNEVGRATVKNYISIPAVWESQHMWNHLGNLSIDKFTYDAENEVYVYNIVADDLDDLYLMTYLSYSLTPMLSDTLVSLYLIIENGEITKLMAQTEKLYYSADGEESTDDDPGSLTYSTIEVSFSDIGTTVVADPAVYEAPDNVDKLTAALERMQKATSYSFKTVDIQTVTPSLDDDDYSYQSLSNKITTQATSAKNYVSATGTVGLEGKITQDAVLLARTGEYSYTMDGNAYHTEYSGYKKINDTTYDIFEYSTSAGALVGTKQVKGTISDILPDFDFSPNLFTFTGTTVRNTDDGIKTFYNFSLNESSITRDIAQAVSLYSYAEDAEATSNMGFTLTVSEDGYLVSTTFPYSLVSGTYMGYCTTTYNKINTTELPEDTFEGYVPREYKTQWSQYTTKYYSPTFSTLNSREENTAVVLAAIFGDNADKMPSPEIFLDIFGDNIYGPFYDWLQVSTDAEGNPVYHGSISITLESQSYDENRQVTNFDEIMKELIAKLGAAGFAYSAANSDITGGTSGRSDRILTFINDYITIVIENNYTKNFWVEFYITGDWTLKRG